MCPCPCGVGVGFYVGDIELLWGNHIGVCHMQPFVRIMDSFVDGAEGGMDCRSMGAFADNVAFHSC